MVAMAEDDNKVVVEKKFLEKLEMQADTDQLTGLRNRRSGEEAIAKLLGEGRTGAFLMLDLDHYKKVNDTYGHIVGDNILRMFGRILSSCTRKDDVVYRYGGDEFCAFLKDFTDPDTIALRCQELIAKTEDAAVGVLDEKMLDEFSVSIGVSLYPDDGADVPELTRNADKALYAVKQSGGRGYYFFSGEHGSIRDLAGRRDAINILRLRSIVEEQGHPDGAYSVERDDFKKIYRFLKRYCERSKTGVQLVLLTLKDVKVKGDEEQGSISILDAEHELGEVIGSTLRRGDVTAQYGPNQFLILLMDTDTEKGKIAVDRVMKNWEKKNRVFDLEFEIQDV